MIKLGLVPYGEIRMQTEDSPTLTYNTINRHISKMVYTKVVTNKSPWLQQAELGKTYCNPASHGEGRFVAPKEWLDKLFANGQVGMSTDHIWRSRVSPVRMDVSLVRWLIPKDEVSQWL